MKKIANYFQFPFQYSPCSLDVKNNDKKIQDTLISREEFLATKYNDFFGAWFMETVSKGYIYSILDSYNTDGRCGFVLHYPNTFISNETNCLGLEVYFSIEKIQGQYKFTSSWISP